MEDAIDQLTRETKKAEADLVKLRCDAKNGATLNAVMEQTALIYDVKANTDLLPGVAKNLEFIRDVMCGKAPVDPNASLDDGADSPPEVLANFSARDLDASQEAR